MGAEHLNGNNVFFFNYVTSLHSYWDDVIMYAWMSMEFWCNDTDKGNGSIRRETCPSATLSTTNSTSTGKGLKQDLRC